MSPAEGIALVGAGGRVGRLLQAHWRQAGGGPLLAWGRQAGALPGWDLLCDPVPAALGGVGTLVCLADPGETAGTGARAPELACAALAAAGAAGLKRLICLSSIAVYGAAPMPWREATPPRPGNAYGQRKRAMEQALHILPDNGVERCFLRLGNVIGADALSGAMRAHWRDGRPLQLDRCGPRGPLRMLIGATELARVLFALARSPTVPRLLNVAQPGLVGMADLLVAARVPFAWRCPAPGSGPARAEMAVDALQATLVAAGEAPLAAADPTALIAAWRASEEI